MSVPHLIFRNAARHPLRNLLTALGIAVALFAFCLIRTMIDAWYAGVRASANDRLIVRNAVSLVFQLPLSYAQVISRVEGVDAAAYGNWFGGKAGDERYFFQQFGVSENYLELYPENRLTAGSLQEFRTDRRGALVGKDVAERFGWEVGDAIQLQGTAYAGLWEFSVRGIFDHTEKSETRNMFFHWEYLNERVRQQGVSPPDQVGFYVVRLQPGANAADVGAAIDARFANSFAETLTETETAFVQGFVSMSSTIITALNAISVVVLCIMLLVLTNTMLMSARERYREYSILKAIGFSRRQIFTLVLGEACVITAAGLLLLALLLTPLFTLPERAVLGPLSDFFPVFRLRPDTVLIIVALAASVAAFAGTVPGLRIMKLPVTEGLRRLE